VEDSAAGVVEGNVMPTNADQMANESNAVQSEGQELSASLNAQLRSRQQHIHVQPQIQSSVMPGRKRRSTRRLIPLASPIVVAPGRRKRRQTSAVENVQNNGNNENDSNSNKVHYVIAPGGDGLEFTCQAASNSEQMGMKKGLLQNVSIRSQEEGLKTQNDENANGGSAGAISVISGNTLRVVCKV
jgi:hypothetical protein